MMMRAMMVAAVGCGALVAFSAGPATRVAVAANQGPTLEVGAPSLQGGKVLVPITATGSGFAPFGGFQLHLRWDPAVFALSGANADGAAFDPNTARGLCIGPKPTSIDADGGGALYGCAALARGSSDAPGLLATFVLTPRRSGCSAIHLTTVAEATQQTASFTADPAPSAAPQANTYKDGSANTSGQACQGGEAVVPGVTAGPSAAGQPPAQGTVPIQVPQTVPPADLTPRPAGTGVLSAVGTPAPALATAIARATGGLSTVPAGAAVLAGQQSATAAAAKTATGEVAAPSSKSSGGGTSTALIIGIVAAAAVVAAGGAGYLFLRRRAG